MNVSRRSFVSAVAGPSIRSPGTGGLRRGEATRDFDNSVRFGFDYHEPSVSEVENMSQGDFEHFREDVLASPIRCLRLNFFTSPPAEFKLPVIRVVGPVINPEEIRNYVEKGLERSRQLGAQIVVWSSAASRTVAEGFSRDHAWEQIKDFLRIGRPHRAIQEHAIAIERIRAPGSNNLSTGADIFKMQRS